MQARQFSECLLLQNLHNHTHAYTLMKLKLAKCWNLDSGDEMKQQAVEEMSGLPAESESFITNRPLQPTGAAGLLGLSSPELLFLIALRIDFCNDWPGHPFHAPPAIHCSNTNNYTIITSPAAPAEQRGATAPASGSVVQLAINL